MSLGLAWAEGAAARRPPRRRDDASDPTQHKTKSSNKNTIALTSRRREDDPLSPRYSILTFQLRLLRRFNFQEQPLKFVRVQQMF